MSIDWWTLGIQAVNVAILIWLLQRFFWRPVAAMIARRREETRAALDDAQATDAKVREALAAVDRSRAGFAAEHDAILQQAHATATAQTAALLADAAQRVATLEAAGQAAIAAARVGAEQEWASRANALALEIAGRLAARLDGAAVRAGFLDWLLAHLRALDAAARQATDGAALEIVSAAPLDDAEQARIADAIRAALGTAPVLAFRVDPALIAGIELRGPHLAVANSWQADLAAIGAALAP